MEKVWEIPPKDEEEILVLSEEGSDEPVIETSEDLRFEITQVDKGPYFIEGTQQATLGVVRGVDLRGTEFVLDLDSYSGSHYLGRIPNEPKLGSRAGFLAPDVLHEGWYVARRVRIVFRRDPNAEEWRIPIRLPLIRVHRPHRDGCTGEVVMDSTVKTEADATFEFLGIKGGAGLGFTTGMTTALTAASDCQEESIPATLLVEHGATLVNERPVAYGVRYRIVDVDFSDRKTTRIPPDVDICGKVTLPAPEPKPQFWTTFDKIDIPASKADKATEGAKIGSTGYVSIGLGAEVGSAPLKLSVEMKRTMEWEYDVKAVLSGGAKYLRFPAYLSVGGLPFELCWSVLEENDTK